MPAATPSRDAPPPDPEPVPRPPRKASRASRREQLIEATIEVVAERGLSRTTLAEVAARAGVAHGLVNFHFKSKDILLTETLLYLAEEYHQNWTSALAAAPADDPAARLAAMIAADFAPAVISPLRLAAWSAFRGEAQSRPLYQAHCGANDSEYTATIEAICEGLVAAGGYRLDPQRAARVIRVTLEGLWLDLIIMTEPYSVPEALATIHTCAAALFPRHFDADGLRAPAGAPQD